ncbi:MAG: phosphonate ABC transporter, permease protein PhnE [Candidatus Cloacimonadaceae bacterium]|nr:phosphonate ABC transporter, permease protein PhnE [Candidatus Cloacimonadaceae bacterium]MDP3115245.1 phosphonate ABC transporter, permease protein PhnE [Candidatus Cloacimonadaceae bacterium]
MRFIKAFGIEYVLWLYIIACAAWLSLRFEIAGFPGWLVLSLPVFLGGGMSALRGSLGAKMNHGNEERRGFPLWKIETALLLILSFVMGWVIVEVKPVAFFTQAQNTAGIIGGIFNPNPAELVPMLDALVETIFLALLATVFAIPFAFLLSFFAAKNLMFGSLGGKAVYMFIRTLSTIFRSIEAIVWAIIFCVWVGIGPFAGMLALWIHSIASLIKLYSEQIENIDPGPVEAIKATGASTLQVWRYAVAPQILAPYLAFTIYRWDINVRMATIVGFVGGGGIGLALYQQQQMLAWRNVGLIMWLIALVVWVMDMFSAYIREKLVVN